MTQLQNFEKKVSYATGFQKKTPNVYYFPWYNSSEVFIWHY